jgi:hypothetical protein
VEFVQQTGVSLKKRAIFVSHVWRINYFSHPILMIALLAMEDITSNALIVIYTIADVIL